LIELSLDDVDRWMDSRMESMLRPLAREWDGLKKDIERALNEVKSACERIREEGEKCLADKDHRKHRPGKAALRFYRMISGVLEAVKIPPGLSSRSLAECQKDLARLYNAIGREWAGLLAQMEPYMIRARRKLKGAWRRIGGLVREMDALAAKCQPLELKEEVSSSLLRLRRLLSDLEGVRGDIAATSVEEEELKKRLEGLLEEKERLEGSEVLRRLREAEEALDRLRLEVRTELRHAWKGLIKMRASASAGALLLSPGDLEALAEYLSSPAEALAGEEEGYPALRSLLEKLGEAVEKGMVSLKASKAEKLARWLKGALSGSLGELQARCKKVIGELEEIRSSEEAVEALEKLRELGERISEVERKLELLENRLNSLRSREKGLEKKIRAEVRALEDLLSEVAGEEVRVAIRI